MAPSAHAPLAAHSGKAWGPWPVQRGDSPPCSYCSCASSPCQSTETNGTAHPCASAPLVWSPQAWRLVTITCPEQNLKTTSLPSACSLKVYIFSLTLCRDLRCSSSVPLSLMAWINADHTRTWHRAGAHLGAGDSCRRGCSLSITKIRGSWASQLLSKQQLHKLKLPRARWSKLARPVRPGVQVL